MKNSVLFVLGAIVVAAAIVGFGSVFTVHQTEQALVLQFGEHRRSVQEPGLHFKIPLIQNVVRYDRRILEYDHPPEEVIASDQKRLVIDTFARFRISDPLLFFRTVGAEGQARTRLASQVSAGLRRVVGAVPLNSVLSVERAQIMRQVRDHVAVEARQLGIEVVDVRFRRADLPEANAQAIFARMQSEREREAREARAQGAETAQRIRARADRERTVLLAEAKRDSEIQRGEGDSEAVRIYGEAFGQDKAFFGFYRSMQAYREALGSDTTMVLSPDSDFFRYFRNLSGVSPEAPRR
jgi:modulator of FtsH protease HflC